jgi:8-oxo-dGTP pyrophosphatase MutT (NUDIX family)
MYDFIYKLSCVFQKSAKSFWGKQASGFLFFCPEDNTILLCKRSNSVEDPGTWGISGGAVGNGFYENSGDEDQPDNSLLLSTAIKETEEELGSIPNIDVIGTTDFKSGSFLYRTFISKISLKEKENFTPQIKLNWENTDFKWFDLNNLPAGIHFGVSFALSNFQLNDSLDLDDYNFNPRPHYVSPMDKSTNNYGYMTIQEMPAINQNEW